MNRRTLPLLAAVVALATVVSSCNALKDPEPFTQDITLNRGIGGGVTVEPLRIEGDTSFGEITVHNETPIKHGFAIRDLSIFAEIPPGKSKVVAIQEAKDNTTYYFECHIHDDKGPEYRGELVIKYQSEELRR